MSKTKPKYSHEPSVDDRLMDICYKVWQEMQKVKAERIATDNRAIGYSMCDLDVWDVIESLDLPLYTRIKMVERFNEQLEIRKVTNYQLTENDLNNLI